MLAVACVWGVGRLEPRARQGVWKKEGREEVDRGEMEDRLAPWPLVHWLVLALLLVSGERRRGSVKGKGRGNA